MTYSPTLTSCMSICCPNSISSEIFESGAFERNCDNVTAAYFDMKGQESSDWTLNLSPNWVLDIGGEDFDTGEARDFDENMGKAIIGAR